METLDRCFENVCELDLIFHMDKVHYILQVMAVTSGNYSSYYWLLLVTIWNIRGQAGLISYYI